MATSTHNVTYVVVNGAEGTRGGNRFNDEIGAPYTEKVMDSATVFIWWLFQQKTWEETKQVKNVKLTISPNLGTFAEVQNDQIFIGANYMENFQGDLLKDFTGLIYFCMAQVWQWDRKGNEPVGLVTGIADYVRLKADYPVANWSKPGEGDEWDQGFEKTAHFLNFCQSGNHSFIVQLNQKLKDRYTPGFFHDITRKRVDQLWIEYKKNY